MMKKLFTFLFAALMSVGMWAAPAPCGQNLTWNLAGGALTISGSGAMYDFDFIDDPAPWYSSRESITSVTIPNGVTSIGNDAFLQCSNLTSITIPNSVTSIGNYAFGSCSKLTSVTIPGSVTSIGYGAFEYCGLTSITIPNSVTSIGWGAFAGCTGLTSMVVASENTTYDSRDCNAIIETSSNTLIAGCKNTIIPNSVTSIGGGAFEGCFNLTSITIPSSVTNIGYDAFHSCGITDVYCYPNAADLTWDDENDDFIRNPAKATNCHVPANYYDAYVAKFDATVNVTFVGDLPNETIVFNDLGLANEYNLTTGPLTVGNIELNFAQNSGINIPKYYTTEGGTARIYSGNSMSISAGGATITKIVFNLTQGTPTFDTGSYDSTTKTWEGEATTLTLSNEMASGQVRIVSMDVYYTEASTGYSVSLKEGTDDATSWQGKAGEGAYKSLPLTGLEAGTAVSVKYNGTKTVWSVKAKKKAAAPLIVNPVVGQVIGDDGKNYDYASLPGGVTAVAKITYVGSDNGEEAPYNHGLALALTDEGQMTWDAAMTACNTTKNESTPVTGATWLLASQAQWKKMGAQGSSSSSAMSTGFESVGGSNMQTANSASYWSSTEKNSSNAYLFYSGSGVWNSNVPKSNNLAWVRACLAWAEGSDPEPIELTSTDGETWTLTMPDGDVELEVTCFNATAPTANTTDIHARTTTPLINAASTTEEGATIKYLVTATSEQPTSTDGFSADVPTAQAITAPGTYYVWYYLDFATGDDSDIYPTAIQVTVAAAPTVTLKEGTEDADNWTITPPEAKTTGVAEGTEVTATYSGTKLVKSVKAVKKAPAPTSLTITDGYEFSTLLDIAGCTTWDEVIAKNSDKIKKVDEGYITDSTGQYGLLKGKNTAVKADDLFDPNATDYKWVEGN